MCQHVSNCFFPFHIIYVLHTISYCRIASFYHHNTNIMVKAIIICTHIQSESEPKKLHSSHGTDLDQLLQVVFYFFFSEAEGFHSSTRSFEVFSRWHPSALHAPNAKRFCKHHNIKQFIQACPMMTQFIFFGSDHIHIQICISVVTLTQIW